MAAALTAAGLAGAVFPRPEATAARDIPVPLERIALITAAIPPAIEAVLTAAVDTTEIAIIMETAIIAADTDMGTVAAIMAAIDTAVITVIPGLGQ
jgi:hypothetical protein